jgi:type II secretory pathway pseudopilin PulG
MRLSRKDNQDGFTMIVTVIGLSLMAMLVLVAVTAVNGDSHLTSSDLQQKQAYEAAKAGIDDYAYRLHANNSYWTNCANVTGPTAVNLMGSTTNRLTVPGTTGAEYAIELLPSTSQTKYTQCNSTHATESMLQSVDPLKGTFRIRSNGYAGNSHTAIVATFKPASFLDYVYFTQRETSDPVTYGEKSLIEAAEKQCSKTIKDGRYNTEIAYHKWCDAISFVTGDFINGPMHTNDAFAICGTPTLGGSAADPIEVSGPPVGWFSTSAIPNSGSNCEGSSKNFKGTLTANAAVLTPPPTNEELSVIAQSKFKGQVRICLSGQSMTVMTYATSNSCASPSSVKYSGAIPSNGVVYVESGACPKEYSPFNTSYEVTTGTSGNVECGNAYVEGTYTGQLTIATYNDIIITGNLCAESCSAKVPLPGEAVLGLVANNFVRIYHPVELKHPQVCEKHKVNGKTVTECVENTSEWECTGNATGSLSNGVTIDAAILAISHSFIVDNYNCGAQMGTLTVNGAIAQYYRGAVGTGGGSGSGGTGYLKSYNYDSRLKYIEPPSFIAPVKTAWVIGRETLE